MASLPAGNSAQRMRDMPHEIKARFRLLLVWQCKGPVFQPAPYVAPRQVTFGMTQRTMQRLRLMSAAAPTLLGMCSTQLEDSVRDTRHV